MGCCRLQLFQGESKKAETGCNSLFLSVSVMSVSGIRVQEAGLVGENSQAGSQPQGWSKDVRRDA